MTIVRRFFAALSFLTRLPVPCGIQIDEASLAASLPFFPAAGASIGLLVAGLDWLARALLHPPVAALLDVAAAFVLSGGLHLDGLMDTADGLLSGRPRERAMEIMKDSKVGAMGVSAAIFVIGLKAAAIATLPASRRFAALILVPALGRYSMCIAVAAFPYARAQGGLGTLFKTAKRPRSVTVAETIASGILAAFAAILTLGIRGGVSIVACALLTVALGRSVTGFLGGLTGDVYGAVCELAEAAAYLVLAAKM